MTDETQMDSDFSPEGKFVIKDLDTLKVISDPLRVRIAELLREKPLTVKEIAACLDTTPTKLYYHIKLLEEHNLIRVVSTRIVSGIIEKQYRIAAAIESIGPCSFNSRARPWTPPSPPSWRTPKTT